MQERKKDMDYSKFRIKILEELKDFYGKDASVKIQKVYKNNDIEKYGIIIRFINDEPDRIVPVIYLEGLYDCYTSGSMDMEDCIGKIINEREEALNHQEKGSTSLAGIMKWENVRQNIYPVLISTEANKELLKDLVSIDMLDLSIVYIIRSKCTDTSCFASIKVKKCFLDCYGISREQLHMQALSNMKKDGYGFYELAEVTKILMNDLQHSVEGMKKIDNIANDMIYIMTNSALFYGTAGILDSQWLYEKTGGISCYIIPSSVHELLFVPDNGYINQEELDEMIQETNNIALMEDEKLSDHCYYYDAEIGEIRNRK